MLPSPQRVTRPLLAVLEELIDHPDGVHGYDVARNKRQQRPTVYLVLGRLERWKWTSRTLEDATKAAAAGRAPRHIHKLTPGGEQAARRLLDARRPTPAAA